MPGKVLVKNETPRLRKLKVPTAKKSTIVKMKKEKKL